MKKLVSLENFAYLTLLAMPAYLVRFSFLGMPTNLFEILALVTMGLFVKHALSSKIELGGYKMYIMPVGMILVGLVLSTLYNEAGKNGWGIVKSWFVVPLLFAWVCAQLFENKKTILRAIYYSAFGVACVALGYFFLGQVTFDGRLQAFYNSPNYLAMYLAPAILIGIFLIKENRKFYLRSLGVLGLALYLTQSYAAWLSILMALFIVALSRQEKLGWKKIVAVLFVGGSFFLLQTGTPKLANLLHPTERSSTSSRLMIWKSALKIGWDNPVLGIGPGNFQQQYLDYQKYFPPYLEWAVPQPHNLFLALWLQVGLLGLVGFGWLLVVWFQKIISSKEKSIERYVFLAMMLYILLHGLVDTTYFKNDLAVVFWVVIFAIKNPSRGDGNLT